MPQYPTIGSKDVFVAKISPKKRVEWLKRFGYPGKVSSGTYLSPVQAGIIVFGICDTGLRIDGKEYAMPSAESYRYMAMFSYTGEAQYVQPLQLNLEGRSIGYAIPYTTNNVVHYAATVLNTITLLNQTHTMSSGAIFALLSYKFEVLSTALITSRYPTDVNVRYVQASDGYAMLLGQFLVEINAGSKTLLSKGNIDGFIAKYIIHNSEMLLDWVKPFGGVGLEDPIGFCLDSYGNSYIFGITYSEYLFFDNVEMGKIDKGSNMFLFKLDKYGSLKHFTPVNLYKWAEIKPKSCTVNKHNHIFISIAAKFYAGEQERAYILKYNVSLGLIGVQQIQGFSPESVESFPNSSYVSVAGFVDQLPLMVFDNTSFYYTESKAPLAIYFLINETDICQNCSDNLVSLEYNAPKCESCGSNMIFTRAPLYCEVCDGGFKIATTVCMSYITLAICIIAGCISLLSVILMVIIVPTICFAKLQNKKNSNYVSLGEELLPFELSNYIPAGDFEIIDDIAVGASGTVVKALFKHEIVAIKFIPLSMAKDNKDQLQIIQQEIETLM